jgi:predicted HAD superfamily phosphohydrolase
MKIVVEMSPEHYDELLGRLSPVSTEYSLLKNGIVTGGSARENRIIEIACELSEAKALLRVAQDLCAEAAFEIDKGVTLARPFEK